MKFLFKRQKSSSELVKILSGSIGEIDGLLKSYDLLEKIDDYWLPVSNHDKWEMIEKELITKLESMESVITNSLSELSTNIYKYIETNGDDDNISNAVQKIVKSDIIPWCILRLDFLCFEARKSACKFICSLLRLPNPLWDIISQKIIQCPYIFMTICSIYPEKHTLLYGMILRECLRIPSLAGNLIELIPNVNGINQQFPLYLLEHICSSDFDISSEVIATFRTLITSDLFGSFLEKEYNPFFDKIDRMLRSETYIIKRHTLKLLHDIFVETKNLSSMLHYISIPQNLQIIMILLRDDSPNIQFEAFNIFKIFVINPHKPKVVHDILIANKPKLIPFLKSFLPTRDDKQFHEEKEYLLQEILSLPTDPQPHNPDS